MGKTSGDSRISSDPLPALITKKTLKMEAERYRLIEQDVDEPGYDGRRRTSPHEQRLNALEPSDVFQDVLSAARRMRQLVRSCGVHVMVSTNTSPSRFSALRQAPRPFLAR